jgi:two-component system, OmpR family, response regulator CpxR
MRPKKIILCVDDNEQELSVRKFMLSTNERFNEAQVDLVLADYAMPRMNGAELIAKLKQLASHVPMVLLADAQQLSSEPHRADAVLGKKNCSPVELLERIKIMSARKRGPRKGTLRATLVPAELAAAS